MTVQNIVLIVSVVGLLFSFYYIYTLDFKLRELKKEFKNKEDFKNKEESKNNFEQQHQIFNPESEGQYHQEIEEQDYEELNRKITFSDDVICYNKEEHYSDIMFPESDTTMSDITMISESEIDEIKEQNIEEPEPYDSDVISQIPITINYINGQCNNKETAEKEEKEENLENQEEEINSQTTSQDENESENHSSEEEFSPNSCRVKIKTGPRKGQLCGKKTSGTPYCSRHGLYV